MQNRILQMKLCRCSAGRTKLPMFAQDSQGLALGLALSAAPQLAAFSGSNAPGFMLSRASRAGLLKLVASPPYLLDSPPFGYLRAYEKSPLTFRANPNIVRTPLFGLDTHERALQPCKLAPGQPCWRSSILLHERISPR